MDNTNCTRFVQIGSSLERKVAWMKYTRRTGFLVQNANGHWAMENQRPQPGHGPYIEVLPTGEARNFRNRKDRPGEFQAYIAHD